MKRRRALAEVPASGVAVAVALGALSCMTACDDEHGWRGHHEESSIVFGIEQTKNADGKITTSVGYEMLDLLSRGSRARGITTDEESCWAERLDDRLGQPRVAGGVATFQGGLLPAGGVAVVANRSDDLTLDGAAWTNPGEVLTFSAKGFAMPDIDPAPLKVPSLDLAILSPADATAEVAIAATGQELEVGWTPSDPSAPPENVVASLVAVLPDQPNARGVELRCFFERSAGTGHFPARMMDRFASLVGTPAGKAITGKLRIATHHQLTIFARGSWVVYVVATAEQREQGFRLTR